MPGKPDVEQDEVRPVLPAPPRWPRGRCGPSPPRGRGASGARAIPRAVSTLSSTTRIRGLPADLRLGGPSGGGRSRRGFSAAGSRTVNSLPLPGPSLVATTLPAVHLDELLDDRQPDPQAPLGAGERAVPLGEELEHLRQLLGRDADAPVLDAR